MRRTTLLARATGLALGVTALGATLLAPVTTTASAEPAAARADSSRTTLADQARADRLSKKIFRLQQRGLRGARLDRAIEGLGLRKVDNLAPPPRLARSGRNDVNVMPPKYFKDEGGRGYWIGAYTWLNDDYTEDESPSCSLPIYDGCKLPGRDAFGIAFNKVLDVTGYSATFGWRDGGGTRTLKAWERNRWGVAFRKTDIVDHRESPDDFNMYQGNVLVMTKGRPCGVTGAWTKYAHTWSNKDLKGVTVALGDISYTFSGTGGKWQVVSQPGRNRKKC
ncbi:hypothetical protein [Nocardioides sp. SYSU D00038]|uniref:hypothetical protein n=1 Tax=Nocardioides sp. SYSU D00038 TaxID=2812554 RepID=UPI0019675482|nr:hypothetical protein [Nocardioides sp. SYSU D00038]